MVKHYSNGEPAPSLSADKLHLYSMAYCPFAQRACLVVSHHNVDHDRININLKSKPSWFLEIFPEGKVPSIVQNGEKMVESDVISEHIDKLNGAQLATVSGEDVTVAKSWWNKTFPLFFPIYIKGEFDESFPKLETAFTEFDTAIIKGPFISGDKVGLADYLVYPMFDRFEAIYLLANRPTPDASRFPKIISWLKAMRNLDSVKKESMTAEQHVNVMKSYIKKENPNYEL